MPSVKLLESAKMSASKETNPCDVAAGIEIVEENTPPAAVEQTLFSMKNTDNAKDALNPVQQMCLIVEHKIRNLEKRKNKLDSYKLLEQDEKILSNDQKLAISKYDECVTSLELARELCKQFTAIATVANRDIKKQTKKNAFLKVQQENAKIRECLVVLDVVSRFTEDAVREDFLNGSNGACQLAEMDIELLMMVHEQTKPKRPLKSTDKPFSSAIRSAAEVLSGVVDGKIKSIGCSSYAHVKSILHNIDSCGYFEKHIEQDEDTNALSTEEIEQNIRDEYGAESETNETVSMQVLCPQPSVASPAVMENQPLMFAAAPAATAVPTPSFPPQAHEIHTNVLSTQQTIIPTILPQTSSVHSLAVAKDSLQAGVLIPTATFNLPIVTPMNSALQLATSSVAATTVQAVENAYFKQHYMQNHLKPIHEVLGDANFFFLQESEIDKPDMPSLSSNYVSVDQPIANLPMQAPVNEFQQFSSVRDSNMALPGNVSIHNTPNSEMGQNVVISNNAGIGSNVAFNNHVGSVNNTQIINIQSMQGTMGNQNSLSSLQLLPTNVQNVSPQQMVPIHMPASSFAQSQQVLPDTHEPSLDLGEHKRSHIRTIGSSNTIVSPTLPRSHVQELAKQTATAHASVQTNKSHVVGGSTEVSQGNRGLYKRNDAIITPASVVSIVYANIHEPNVCADNSKDDSIHAPNVRPKDRIQISEAKAKVDKIQENESLKNNKKNKSDVRTADNPFPMKRDGQSNRKKTCAVKANVEERKECMEGTVTDNNLNKNDEWNLPASSVAQTQFKNDDGTVRGNLNRGRSTAHGQTVDAGERSLVLSSSSDQNQSNGEASNPKYINSTATISNSTATASHTQSNTNLHGVSPHAVGYRNNRSSNPQYPQNGLNNGRFNTENGTTAGHPPTFFKNNERFYQNSFGVHRGGAMYKGRSENLGGNTGRSTNNVFNSNSSSAIGNGACNATSVASEYRTTPNVRSRNNARNNAALGTRLHHRNNSANIGYSNQSRKDSSTITQSGVNF